MPFPRMSKYVRDGEVDPGVADVARAIRATFATFSVDWSSVGYPPSALPDEVGYELDVLSYFVAASGAGVFPGEPFRQEADDPRFVLRKYLARAKAFDDAALLESPWERDWWAPQHTNESMARERYERMLAGEPNLAMLVEALMFYDPTGAFADTVKGDPDGLETARSIAASVASAVPPIGRKWIVAALLSNGMPVEKAKETAYRTYEGGGNYLGWVRHFERVQDVRTILQKVDPDVSDAQVEVVASSPLPLPAIASTFAAIAEGRSVSAERVASEPEEISASVPADKGDSIMTAWILAAGGAAALGLYLWKRGR